MKILVAFSICLALLFATGCDTDRINKLEKENQEMKAKLEKNSAAVDLDLQAKCSKDARTWFNENWSRDKETVLLEFSNHYNAKQNKCFVFVEYHSNAHPTNGDLSSWSNYMTIYDVYENVKYAEFLQNHIVHGKPDFKLEEPVLTCDMGGKQCTTIDEYNNFQRPYMND